MVREKIEEAERLAYVMKIAPDEAWLLAYIIGQNGGRIQSLRKGSGCQIDVSKETRTITITGTSENDVASVREKLTAIADKGRRENVFIRIPEKAIPAFVGRASQHLQDWSKKYGVDIQRVRGSTQFKVVGEATKNESFKAFAEEWLAEWEASHASVVMTIEKLHVAAVLGAKGSTAQAIEKEFGCRVDVDRTELKVTIKGGDEEKRQATLSKIKEIINRDETVRLEAANERKEKARMKADAASVVEPSPPSEIAPTVDGPGPMDVTKQPKKSSAYPSMPIGLQQAPKKANGKKAYPTSNLVVEGGTEQGRDLFNLLIS
jgi:polyribonucleotide nucleotidyltransferase